jgi:hypothetical protein
VTPVLPLHALDVEQLDVGLVDECRRVEGVAVPLAPEVRVRSPPEVVVNLGEQLVQGGPVAASALAQPGEWRKL